MPAFGSRHAGHGQGGGLGLGDLLGGILGGGSSREGGSSGGPLGPLGDILGGLLGGGAPQQPTQAPSSGGTGGFQAPTSDGGLRIDPGTSAPRQSQPQSPMGGGAGDLLGGLLKEILIGRR